MTIEQAKETRAKIIAENSGSVTDQAFIDCLTDIIEGKEYKGPTYKYKYIHKYKNGVYYVIQERYKVVEEPASN